MPPSGNLALDGSYRSQPARIQTAVLSRPGKFVVELQEKPDCSPDQVLIRVEGCGICASNLPVWEGRDWFQYPLEYGAPGHEGWGEIIEVGEKVQHLHKGQRVACLAGNAFAQYVAVDANQAVVLPPELDGIPFPGEAIGCAMNIFRRADVQAGQSVAIIGAGFLGLLLVQLAVSAGAQVYVLSRRQSVRNLAERFGAHACFDTDDWWGNALKVVEMTGGKGCDRVIEVTGLQFALDTATEMIAEYGKLIVGGYHQDGMRQVNFQKWNWRAIDVINAHERDPRRYVQGIEEGIQATIEGRIRPLDLLTHKFGLEDLNTAHQMMLDRPDGFIKGWVEL